MLTTPAPATVGVIAYAAADPATRRIVVYRIRTDGSYRRQLTETESSEPAWSPDGTRIAYVRRNGEIWLMSATGGNQQPTGAVGSFWDAPAWSPDGQRFSYSCGSRRDLCVYDLQTHQKTVVVAHTSAWPYASSPTWSPDGVWIAFARVSSDGDYSLDRQLFVVHPDGSQLTAVSNTFPYAGSPAWSPDGQTILYTERYDSPSGGSITAYSIRADGTAKTQLLGNRGYDDNAAWSSDGQRIALESGGRYSRYSAGIWTTAPDGTDGRLVVRRGYSPTWRPDFAVPAAAAPAPPQSGGRRIAYLAATDEGYDVFTVRPDGTQPIRLTTDGRASSPTWSPDHSQIAYTAPGVWVMNAQGGERRRLAYSSGSATDIAWSPKGDRIVWARDTALVVINVRSGDRLRIPIRNGGYSLAHPTWAPDGRHIAFSEEFFWPGGDDIVVVPASGGTPRRIRLKGSQLEPTWGPHGWRLVFTHARGPWQSLPSYLPMLPRTRVVSTTTRGTDLRVLMDTGGLDHAAAWSPSGHRLALFSDGPKPFGATPQPGLWTMGHLGVDPQWVVRDKSIAYIDW